MRNNFLWFMLLSAMFISSLSLFSIASGDIQCLFSSGTSCPAGMEKLLGVKNDSDGFNNAHVQNRTFGTYAYSFCCNNTNSSINVSYGCDGAVFLRLSNESNAHVEAGNNSGSSYPVSACINSTYQNLSCSYPDNSCAAGATCLLSIANSEGSNDTNAHVANCSVYTKKVCCTSINHAPSAPVLEYPVNGNDSVSERFVNFTWQQSTDLEGNPITYTINFSCGNCLCANQSVGSLSGINFTHSSELCVDKQYNWTVTACDNYNECNTSARWNFTIASSAIFDLIVNTTDFGGMGLGQSKETNSTLQALVGRNNGNVRINATVNASAIFYIASFPASNYLYKAADNESGSILPGCSQTSFAQMSATQGLLFCNLSWNDSSDEVKIDLNITVPLTEPPGQKRSTIFVEYVTAEI